jgi:putative nucleotidyltransferase with HDIG domain
MMAGIVRALTAAIDAKDQYTCGHSERVARIAVRLAQELKCDGSTLNMIYLAGLLHDIGKIGIADKLLHKPGRLSDDEYQQIKTHTEIGHRILRDLKKLDNILPVILHHHEAWDGGGYPLRLHADEIPLAARIVAVADSYDAMGSDRPYRKGMSAERIEEIFRRGAGLQWDPEVITAFFRARDDIREIVEEQRRELAVVPRQRK